MPTIRERYAKKFANSVDWYQRGVVLFAGGVTHQTRFTSPFPVYIDYAEGPFKYDVDGNQITDISVLANMLELERLNLSGNQISDISPLVENSGLGSGDRIRLVDNNLDLSAGSDDLKNIEILKTRGSAVDHDPLGNGP